MNLIKVSIFCLFFSNSNCLGTVRKNITRSTENLCIIKWMELSEIDKDFLVDSKFVFVPLRGKVGRFEYGATIMQPFNYYKIVCSMFLRFSSNAYQPTVLKDVAFEFCSIFKNNNTLVFGTRVIREFYPDFLTAFQKYIHPCPYLPGRYDFNVTVDKFIMPDIVPPVDGKMICRNSDVNDKTIVVATAFFVIKRGYPAG